jgi:hypothetical protein
MTLAINVGYDGSWKDTISNQMDGFCEIYLRASGTSSWRAFPSPENNDDTVGGQSTEPKLFPFNKSALGKALGSSNGASEKSSDNYRSICESESDEIPSRSGNVKNISI